MKKWDEVEKKIIQTRYGPTEIPLEDCWMPDSVNVYLTLKGVNIKDNQDDMSSM